MSDSGTLRARLAARHPASEVLPGLRTDTLLASAERLPPRLAGVVLHRLGAVDLLRALVALDGRAASIFLAPPDAGPEALEAYAERAGCSALLGPGRSLDTLPARAQEGPAETRWVLATSGTTAAPKLVGHTLASLTRSTRTNVARGAGLRWGLLYDPSRYAGLQVVLQALLGGSTLLAPALDAPLPHRVAALVAGGCTHLSATPTLWRRLLMTPASASLPLQQITLGGEIADQALLDRLRAAFPEARIAHIFASTEAGVGFSVTDGRAGFPRRYLEEPPRGIALSVREGRLYVKNGRVEGAYLGQAGAAFRDREGFVDTGDAVEIRGDRVLFLGRASGVINVGGQKVHPERVEAVLLAHPGVAAARVGQRRSPITGALVTAEVTPAPDAAAPGELKRELRAHCAALLAPHERPATVRLSGALRMSAAGKLLREVAP
ncbi:MAG: fatty acid--CoA ligase family protein [Myxococcota bacterium]